jgi:hypothetical protein
VWGLQNVVFPMPGDYNIRILVDGQEKKAFRLFAEEVPHAARTVATSSLEV